MGSAVEGAKFPGSTASHVGRPVSDTSQRSVSKPSIAVIGESETRIGILHISVVWLRVFAPKICQEALRDKSPFFHMVGFGNFCVVIFKKSSSQGTVKVHPAMAAQFPLLLLARSQDLAKCCQDHRSNGDSE